MVQQVWLVANYGADEQTHYFNFASGNMYLQDEPHMIRGPVVPSDAYSAVNAYEVFTLSPRGTIMPITFMTNHNHPRPNRLQNIAFIASTPGCSYCVIALFANEVAEPELYFAVYGDLLPGSCFFSVAREIRPESIRTGSTLADAVFCGLVVMQVIDGKINEVGEEEANVEIMEYSVHDFITSNGNDLEIVNNLVKRDYFVTM